VNGRYLSRIGLTAILLLVVLAATSSAQAIRGPSDPVKEHALVRLEVDDPAGASWVVLPAGPADLAEVDGGRQLVFSAPPGTYTVLAAVVVDGRPRILSRQVNIGLPEPTPLPVTPPEPPTPVVVPPSDGSEALHRTASAYATAVPSALREAAEAIRTGRISMVNEAVELVALRREEARGPYGRALDEATRGAFDQSGKVVDPDRYATALLRAARAMEGVRP
jgi:hypothetical protein